MILRRISVLLFVAIPIFGQQGALSLNSVSTTPGGSAALKVSTSANGGGQPAVLRWTMQYPADVTGIDVVPGAAAASAGKNITCSYGASLATCLAWGENATVIPDGVVATATFKVSAASTSAGIAIASNEATASDVAGNSLPINSTGGTITVVYPPAISCTPTSGPRLLNQYYSARCSVTGGTAPFNWMVSSGALPPGLMLGSQGTSAQITGSPTVAGVYRYTISVVDSTSPVPQSATLAYAVTIQSSASTLGLVGSLAHLVSNQDWTTTFTLVNTSASDAQTELNLLDDDGNSLPLPLALPQQSANESLVTTPSFDWTLASNSSLIVQTDSSSAPLQSGSAQLAASGGISGFAIFHLNSTAQEAVVPLETRNASSYLLPFDNTNGSALGVALANIGAPAASVNTVVRDDSGVQIASGSLPVPSNGHSTFVLSNLFPVTAGVRGTVEFAPPAGGRINVLGVRTTTPGTLTSIPALANVAKGGGTFAHIAIANGWKTSFVLVNTGVSAAQVHLNFFDDSGSPLVLPLSSPQSSGIASTTASSIDSTMSGGATLVIESTGPDANTLQTGSAQLTTDGNVSGFAIYRYEPSGQEAVVPLEDRNASSYILAFDNTSGTATGVAVSSSSQQGASVAVVIRDDGGSQIGSGTIPLSANGHSAFGVGNLFPVTEGKRGTLEFVTPADGKISVLGIRTPAANTFTTLPAL
ncbi:MAG: putative Ig domain-containing protein, partial [Acidobacteriota bacterium]|nr:putative Ig domain-containing protein [Acidobacteriota bacterium]